jgi:uncharacterized membrane protein
MRTVKRGGAFGCALLLAAALSLSACQPPGEAPNESGMTQSDAEREAEMAAEQLAALGGPANAEQRALYEGEFHASGGLDPNSGEGTEAAWELRLLNDYAQFARPGLGEDGGIPGERDYRERGMRVVAGPVTVTIRREACTASGLELEYVASVLFEGVAYQGCARRGIDDGARSTTWASVLPELIPAIDACLARVTSRPARITFASSIDGEQVMVRIREQSGIRRECIADASGAGVGVYEPVSDLDRRAGEGDPEFQRGGAQPSGRCVSEAPGLGWLIERNC